MKRITIIGGGASGTLLAVNLIRNGGDAPLELNLIEKNSRLGRGVAYGTAHDFHLLNVPAAKMGAFPDRVEHFHEWLTANGYDYAAGDFVPRKIYGEYLRQIFAGAIAGKNPNTKINLIEDEAVDVLFERGEATVVLQSGERLPTDKIVLAFGNSLPPHISTENQEYIKSEKYFQNPWCASVGGKIAKTDDVLLIGTGLTAIDLMMSFYYGKHTGKIFALSTHGLLPAVHAPAPLYSSFAEEVLAQSKVTSLLKIVRRHIEKAENWRSVIDAMRPATQKVWQKLNLTEKRRFMRHLRRIWDVSRHRMPPQCAAILQKLQSAEQLNVLRGKIRNIETVDNKFIVTYGKNGELKVDAIINCTGSESNFTKIDLPLVKNLLAKGCIKPDDLFLGLEANSDGTLTDSRGQYSGVFFTLGTALKGTLWESTAMPEIRAQARDLALRLLA
jgi:uncharacterized NAD(P)/FAD-binding protein YdhS